MSGQSGQVRKRRVFHIPGYDPFHPRRYRELYRTEGAAQAEITLYQIATGDAARRIDNGNSCLKLRQHQPMYPL